MLRQIIATGCVAVFFAGPAFAGEATVTINKISSDGIGAAIGTIILKDGHHGLKVTPDLHDLPDITAGTDGRGRSIMVHRYGTNDPGKPKGGGPRYACDVIPK